MLARVLGRLAVLPRPPVAAAPHLGPRRPRGRLRRGSHRLVRRGGLDAGRWPRPCPRAFAGYVPPPGGRPTCAGCCRSSPLPPELAVPPRRGEAPRDRARPSTLRARGRPAPGVLGTETRGREAPRPRSGRGDRPAVGRATSPMDAHTVRVSAPTPPGFVVVLDGHHPDWTAEDRVGPVPVLRRLGRYRALPTPGGERRLHPPLPAPAGAPRPCSSLAMGALAVARPGAPPVTASVSHFTEARACAVLFSARRRMNDRDPDTLWHDQGLTLLDHRVSIR